LIRVKKVLFFGMERSAVRPPLETGIFDSLGPENRRRLEAICVPRALARREVLFHEGDKAYAIYACTRGSIRLHQTAPSGQEVVIKLVKPGEWFAEAVLFERDRYPVTATALEPSRVLMVPRHPFECLLEDPDFRRDFIANLLRKLRYLAGQVQALAAFDVEERLFRFLRDRFGNAREIRTSLSKKDVAAAVGATPETLSRVLLKLKASGRLSWEGRRILLPEPPGRS
jgi:CRP/FNR family transcriptional regulator